MLYVVHWGDRNESTLNAADAQRIVMPSHACRKSIAETKVLETLFTRSH